MVQDVVSRPGWAGGNHVLITIQQNYYGPGANDINREFYSKEGAPVPWVEPRLALRYSGPDVVSDFDTLVATATLLNATFDFFFVC